MSIKEEDFETLSVGTQPPFNSWVSDFPTLANVVAGGTKTGSGSSTRALYLSGGNIRYDTYPTFYTSFSAFVDILPTQQQFLQGAAVTIFRAKNGPNAFGTLRSLFTLQIEPDTTLSAFAGETGPLICNSGDYTVKLYSYNNLQINVVFTASGSNTVVVTTHVALNGVEVMTGSIDSGIQIALLRDYPTQTSAQINAFEFTSFDLTIDNIVLDNLQSIVTYPHAGSPQAIVNFGAAEIPIEPDDEVLNVFQGVSELEILPDDQKLRIYQGVVELILLDTPSTGLWKVKEI
jgi:hypothetical protein